MDQEGSCFSRSWVNFELHQTLLTSGDKGDKVVPIIAGWDWISPFHAYTTMDCLKLKSASDKDKQLINSELQKVGSQLNLMESRLKDMLILGARREMNRAEKLSMVVPRRMVEATTTFSWLLFLSGRYCESEDALRGAKTLIDKVALRDLGPFDEPGYYLHMAMIAREKGVVNDMERNLLTFIRITGALMESEMFLEGSLMMAETLLELRQFTKAERHVRKLIDHRGVLPEAVDHHEKLR